VVWDPGRHLENNDSYNLFAALGDLVLIGPTGTNAADLVLVAVG
jgi:glycerate-2-kinase